MYYYFQIARGALEPFLLPYPLSRQAVGLVGILVSRSRQLEIAVGTVFGFDDRLDRLLRTLFKLVKREKELHREILAFSISHDHRSVRIYCHYPMIDDKGTTFYRHLIHEFHLCGIGRHTSSRRTSTTHGCRPTLKDSAQSSIRCLPVWILNCRSSLSCSFQRNPDFHRSWKVIVSCNNQMQTLHLLGEHDSQSSLVDSPDTTPNTSVSQRTERGAFKSPNKRRAAEWHRRATPRS
jgi:hypothetical protein